MSSTCDTHGAQSQQCTEGKVHGVRGGLCVCGPERHRGDVHAKDVGGGDEVGRRDVGGVGLAHLRHTCATQGACGMSSAPRGRCTVWEGPSVSRPCARRRCRRAARPRGWTAPACICGCTTEYIHRIPTCTLDEQIPIERGSESHPGHLAAVRVEVEIEQGPHAHLCHTRCTQGQQNA